MLLHCSKVPVGKLHVAERVLAGAVSNAADTYVTQGSQLQLVETQLLLLKLKREFIESYN